MKHKFNLDDWERREHFNLFKDYDEPYHSVCIRLECEAAYKAAKEKAVSFYLYYLYQSLRAAQIIEVFRYRILNDEVFIFDRVDAGSTIPGTMALLALETLNIFLHSKNLLTRQSG